LRARGYFFHIHCECPLDVVQAAGGSGSTKDLWGGVADAGKAFERMVEIKEAAKRVGRKKAAKAPAYSLTSLTNSRPGLLSSRSPRGVCPSLGATTSPSTAWKCVTEVLVGKKEDRHGFWRIDCS